MSSTDPFIIQTEKPIVALPGKRNGYLMIAPQKEVESYEELPNEVLAAAKAWAAQLEQQGSPRAYWIILSEVTRHLHIHIYPRWETDTLKGLPLFEQRETEVQPEWTVEMKDRLHHWAEANHVEIIQQV